MNLRKLGQIRAKYYRLMHAVREHLLEKGYVCLASPTSSISVIGVIEEKGRLKARLIHVCLSGRLSEPAMEALRNISRMVPSAEIIVAVPEVEVDEEKKTARIREKPKLYRFDPKIKVYGTDLVALKQKGYRIF